MPYELWVRTNKPMDCLKVSTYDTQNLARWWAVNMAQRGSVSLRMGSPTEVLIPIHRISSFQIKET